MLSSEEAKVYMSLSADPNERGRLWKESPLYKKRRIFKEMSEYYDREFIKRIKEYGIKRGSE